AVGSERGGIGLNANGWALTAADADEANAGELRNFLRKIGVGQIFDAVKRKRLGAKREREDGCIGGIDFAIDGRIGNTWRKKIGCGVDGGLNFLLGNINVQVEI